MRDDVATNDADRMHIGESIGIVVTLPGGLVHEGANRKVRQHQAPELLAHQVGRFAAQDDPGAAQVRLEFIQSRFDLPAFLVQRRQLPRRGALSTATIKMRI